MSELQQAQLALDQGDIEKAVFILTGLLKKGELPFSDRLRALHSRGDALNKMGQFQKAMDDYDQMIELSPDSPASYFPRSLAFYRNGMFRQAIQGFNQMIRLDPDFFYAYLYRSEAFFQEGNFDLAIEDYDNLLRLSPEDVSIFFQRGLAHFCCGNFESAEGDFEACLDMDPRDSYGMTWLYLSRERDGRTGELQLVVQSVNLNPKHWPNPVVFFFLDELTTELLINATPDSNKNIEEKRICEAHFFIGQKFLLLGENIKACQSFKKCLEYPCQIFMVSAAQKEISRLK